jgi:hypothetical protein
MTPTATPTDAVTPTPTRSAAKGDVDCNGRVDAIDAANLLQYIARRTQTLRCLANADVNNDGARNAIDVALVLQYTARLISSL